MVPKSLRRWFLAHFCIDLIFATPLLLFPSFFLLKIGFSVTSSTLVFARLVGAALIGIGGESLLMHKKSKETFLAMLDLKLLWSFAAMIGLFISLLQGATFFLVSIFVVFSLFFFVWFMYKKRLQKEK